METAFDEALKMFIVYIAALGVAVAIITVHSARKLLLAALEHKKILIKVPIEYSDFADVLSSGYQDQ